MRRIFIDPRDSKTPKTTQVFSAVALVKLRSSFAGLLRSAALSLLIAISCLGGNFAGFTLSADRRDALARISAASLRGHLSFIASDTLEGRNTPSPGLDLAAEYIAAQFRRAGLEPAGDDGYFQTAPWILVTPTTKQFRFTLRTSDELLEIPPNRFSLTGLEALRLEDLPVVKVPFEDSPPSELQSLEGQVVITELPEAPQDRSQTAEFFRRRQTFLGRLRALKVPLVLAVNRRRTRESEYFASRTLRDPESGAPAASSPLVATVDDARVIARFDSLPQGLTQARVSINLRKPEEKPIRLRNVVGLLRGSDPVLKESYILLTAHYDHVGMRPFGVGDRIWNGANDNGSGTVSVIEIASVLATLKEKPRRSLVFMTFFGEERGLLGSRYYARHPIFPIEKTVAGINLEQVGRTDSTEGDQTGRASLTGFDYSDIGLVFKAAGELSGIEVYKHEQNSEPYFSRSDNLALAAVGIPSHTLCVAFSYPDYHGPGDHWEKVNFDNMAKTDRLVAIALLMLAENQKAPRWNAAQPRTGPYLKAHEERRPK